MGWASMSRSLITAARRAERESIRQHQLAQAAHAVGVYEEHIGRITNLHKYCGKKYDWEEIQNKKAPVEPEFSRINEKKAKDKYNNYKPNIIGKIFPALKERKINKLKRKIKEAKLKDDDEFNILVNEYAKVYREWEENHNLAKRINDGDHEAYLEAIKKYEPCVSISDIGSYLNFVFDEEKNLDVYVKISAEEIIPKETYKLTKAGKLSVRDMSKSKYNELYQDYVSSSVFRVAREVFALLPIDVVYIHALADLLNTSTGKIEEKAITSVAFVRKTLNYLNLDMIDPSDALKNFVNTSNFKKTKGFAAVEKVKRLNLEN